jgi:hypothetical protein
VSSLIYRKLESPVVFKETGGNVLFTPKNKATGTGRISSQWDRGTGAVAERVIIRAVTKLQGVAAVGAIVNLYVFGSDGADSDGGLGATDADLLTDERRALTPVGVIVAKAATVGPFKSKGYVIELLDRYIQVAEWNEMGQTFTNVAADHYVTITPAPAEIQA